MPNQTLNRNAPDTFCDWLIGEINDASSLVPHTDQIPNNLKGIKGIYFWFMKQQGYTELGKFRKLREVTPLGKKIINGEEFHLVYIGTAGMGRNAGSDLLERLKWHIENKHTNAACCSGALSTLRQGLGALLSDDLIETNTEISVNNFMESYMKVYWISYKGQEGSINEDEFHLIQHLKPLLNIRNNPNALAIAENNSTREYKLRRIQVIESTRQRLRCNQQLELKRPSFEVSMQYVGQIQKDSGNCIEFIVRQNQLIHQVVKGIPGLPKGKVTFRMYDAANPEVKIFPGWGKTGKGKQNIYTYFANTGTGDKAYRYQLVQECMKANGIEEIVVKVCQADDLREPVRETILEKPKFTAIEEITSEEDIKLSKNFIVVMICANRKNGDNILYNNRPIDFKALSKPAINQFLPDDTIPDQGITWRDYIMKNQYQNIIPYQAYQLYYNEVYQKLYDKFGDKLYILSAGWGLVKASFRLPRYSITFSKGEDTPPDTKRNYNQCIYQDFNQLQIEPKEDIIFIGGESYLKLFFDLTNGLDNQKIVYHYGKADLPLPNSTFIYRKYVPLNERNNRTWHYELAGKIAQGKYP